VGPIFQFPTASSSQLGTGRWAAGPTAALVYSEGPWFNTLLTYQLVVRRKPRPRQRESDADDGERGSLVQPPLDCAIGGQQTRRSNTPAYACRRDYGGPSQTLDFSARLEFSARTVRSIHPIRRLRPPSLSNHLPAANHRRSGQSRCTGSSSRYCCHESCRITLEA
jgi:hypothetical protein